MVLPNLLQLFALLGLLFMLRAEAHMPEDNPFSTEQKYQAVHYGLNGHAVWIPMSGKNPKYFFVEDSGQLKVSSDGTAELTGTIKNVEDPTMMWDIHVAFSKKSSYEEVLASGGKFKGTRYGDPTKWDFYRIVGHLSTFKGKGTFAGKTLKIDDLKEEYWVQFGNGANDKNQEFGLSTWFKISGDMNLRGDVNVNLGHLPSKKEEVVLEAECAQIGESWVKEFDANASEKAYVVAIKSNPQRVPNGDKSRVKFIFDSKVGGDNWALNARIMAPNGNDDSFWVRVNDGDWIRWWRGVGTGSQFRWKMLREKEGVGKVQRFSLHKGQNIIEFAYREDGTKLDKIYLANYITPQPDSKGPEAENSCAEKYGASRYASNGHAVYIPMAGQNRKYFFENDCGKLKVFADGTAELKGTIRNAGDPTMVWDIHLVFHEKKSYQEVLALGGKFKGAKYGDPAQWGLYRIDGTQSTFKGKEKFAGKTLNIDDLSEDYWVQLGNGANDKNQEFGLSTWFKISGDMNLRGDVNVVLENKPKEVEEHYLEAECADVGGAWVKESDPNASENTYVVSLKTDAHRVTPGDDARVKFTFDSKVGGDNWALNARILAPNGGDDSFWVRINDGEWIRWWRGVQTGNQFRWKVLKEKEGLGKDYRFSLHKGINTVEFVYRENGTKLDKIYLTNFKARQPEGKGPKAENRCPEKYVATRYASNGHAVYIPMAGQNRKYFFENDCGEFKVFSDGTAELTGTIRNAGDPTMVWDIYLVFHEKTSYQDVLALGGKFKGAKYGDPAQWDLYRIDGTQSTFKGKEKFAGKTLKIDDLSEDYWVQLGDGANDKNNQFGLSTWFKISGDMNLRGDVNVILEKAPKEVEEHYLEAECADVGGAWVKESDPNASENTYVVSLKSNPHRATKGDDARVKFTFDSKVGGDNWALNARILAPNGSDDSFWVRINDGEWIKWWRGVRTGNQFRWKVLKEKEGLGKDYRFSLHKGINTVEFVYRENGTKLDKIYLTNFKARQPEGKGLEAENSCAKKCIATRFGSNGHAVYIPMAGQNRKYFFEDEGGKFKIFSDGTAELTGTVRNAGDPTMVWDIYLVFHEKASYQEVLALGGKFKGANYGDPAQWELYRIDGTQSTFKGKEKFAGKTLNIDDLKEEYWVQLGNGANDKNGQFGLSTWFKISGDMNLRGDVNVVLECLEDPKPEAENVCYSRSWKEGEREIFLPLPAYWRDLVFEGKGARFSQFADGTATLTGTMVNTKDATVRWEVDVLLDDKKTYDEWIAMGGFAKESRGELGDETKWSFYRINGEQSVIKGIGTSNQNQEMYITDSDPLYRFQVGYGANNYNSDYGASGWFITSGSWEGFKGDFNISFECEDMPVADYSVRSADEFEGENFRIYPSPMKDELTVRGEQLETPEMPYNVRLLDITGKTFHEMITKLDTPKRIDVSSLPAGMYTLMILNPETNESVIKRIVKQ